MVWTNTSTAQQEHSQEHYDSRRKHYDYSREHYDAARQHCSDRLPLDQDACSRHQMTLPIMPDDILSLLSPFSQGSVDGSFQNLSSPECVSGVGQDIGSQSHLSLDQLSENLDSISELISESLADGSCNSSSGVFSNDSIELELLLNSTVDLTQTQYKADSLTAGTQYPSATLMFNTSTPSTTDTTSPRTSPGLTSQTPSPFTKPESDKSSTNKVASSIKTSPESDKSSSEGSPNSKPSVSYLVLIAKAILSSPQQRMVLNDIYDYLLVNNPFFRDTTSAWRNSVRYTLSVNECFMKDGRAKSGRGYYWVIHSACLEDFITGDYNRRNARKKVKDTNRRFEESIKMGRAQNNINSPHIDAPKSQKEHMMSPQGLRYGTQQNQLFQHNQMTPGNPVPQHSQFDSYMSSPHGQQCGGGAMRNNVRSMIRNHPYSYSYASPAHLGRMPQSPVMSTYTSPAHITSHNTPHTQYQMMPPYHMTHSQPIRSGLMTSSHSQPIRSDHMTSSHSQPIRSSHDSISMPHIPSPPSMTGLQPSISPQSPHAYQGLQSLIYISQMQSSSTNTSHNYPCYS